MCLLRCIRFLNVLQLLIQVSVCGSPVGGGRQGFMPPAAALGTENPPKLEILTYECGVGWVFGCGCGVVCGLGACGLGVCGLEVCGGGSGVCGE